MLSTCLEGLRNVHISEARLLQVSNGKEIITRYYKNLEALKQQTAAGLRTRAIGNMFFTAV